MTTTYSEQAKQAWIMTHTGLKFHAFDPKYDQISLVDIAHALSRNNRFTGHGHHKQYTVGEHSVHCYQLLKDMGYDEQTQLMGLLHDASEAYLQDIAKPFKRFLPDYQVVEKLVQNSVYLKYLGFIPTKEQYAPVELVDQILLINEVEQLMPEDENWELPDVEKEFVNVSMDMSVGYVKHRFLFIAEALGAIDE